MKAIVFSPGRGGVLLLGLLILPSLLVAQEEVSRLTFETRHQATNARRNYTIDSLDVVLDGSRLSITGYYPSGRTDPEYQTMVLRINGFTGRGKYSIAGDLATWQNLNTGDGFCHSLSGTAEIVAWEPGVTIEGVFRFLCESTPRTGDSFNTIIEGEFVKGLEGKFLSPVEGDTIRPGVEYPIRWQLPGRENFDLYYTLENDPENPEAESWLIEEDLSPADGEYAWVAPDTMSPYLWIIAVDRGGIAPDLASDSLRIRTPRLARLKTDPDGPCPACPYYEVFNPGVHGWREVNGSDSLFAPRVGRSPNYNGVDEISRLPYPSYFLDPPVQAQPDDYPDWPSWVDAFTTDASYMQIAVDTLVPIPERVAVWGMAAEPYNGGCFGMAVTAAYAFYFPEEFASRFPDAIGTRERAENLFVVRGNNPAVNTLVSRFHAYQFGRNYTYQWRGLGSRMRPMETVEWLREIFLSDEVSEEVQRSPVVTISFDGPGGGAHAMLAYEIDEVEDDPEVRVFVYDPNAPGNDNLYVAVDRDLNTWSYAPLGWSGSFDFSAPDFVTHYRTAADYLDEEEANFTPILYTPRGMEIEGRRESGEDFSRSDADGFTASDPDVQPLYTARGPGAPYGYLIADVGYDVEATAAGGSGISLGLQKSDLFFAYRSDASDGEIDHVRWEEQSLTVHNPGTTPRVIGLEAILSAEGLSRTVSVSDLMLAAGDSIRFGIEEDDMVVENYGGATSYNIVLRQLDEQNGFLVGDYEPVDIGAGDRHRIDPPWWNLSTRLPIYVEDGDGGVKDTIIRINSLLGVDGDEGELEGVRITNPLPDLGRLDLRIFHSGHLRVEAFDGLGRMVSLLHDGEVLPGERSVPIDARDLLPGHYLLRITLDGEPRAALPVLRIR